VTTTFTAAHRGGAGPPLLLLHGFTDTWRTWQLVLGALERRHEVLAPTLPGHAGGPPLGDEVSVDALVDWLERLLDDAGWPLAHVAGNSLGGHLALRLAARGRAASVVALAPAGGWADDAAPRRLLAMQAGVQRALRAIAPHAGALAATPEGRRRALGTLVAEPEALAPAIVEQLMRSAAGCRGATTMIEAALRDGWSLDAGAIDCPVRVVWGAEDRLLPWPSAAERYRRDWLPHADWVVLDGVGHAPQLEAPTETAELIAGVTAVRPAGATRHTDRAAP
jgi:pimeloyl-ACP methyl ester carboxylesterase